MTRQSRDVLIECVEEKLEFCENQIMTAKNHLSGNTLDAYLKVWKDAHRQLTKAFEEIMEMEVENAVEESSEYNSRSSQA